MNQYSTNPTPFPQPRYSARCPDGKLSEEEIAEALSALLKKAVKQ